MTREKAIKIVKEFINGTCLHSVDQEALETLIPELRESEDESIRKWILEKVQGYASSGIPCSDEIKMADKAIAYLEKQKEQKLEDKEITLTNFEEVLNTFLFDFANSPIEDCEPKEYTKKHSAEILKAAYTELNAQLKQDIFEAQQEGRREGYEAAKAEQKPDWSEEDERMLSRCIKSVECSKQFADSETYKAAKDVEMNWLKSLSKRFNLQPKQEWSDEDKDTIDLMIAILRENHPNELFKTNPINTTCMSAIGTDMLIKRIEALRPQYHGDVTMTEAYKMGLEAGKASSWKPSEEQMDALNALNLHGDLSYVGQQNQLISLYQDLKKLM